MDAAARHPVIWVWKTTISVCFVITNFHAGEDGDQIQDSWSLSHSDNLPCLDLQFLGYWLSADQFWQNTYVLLSLFGLQHNLVSVRCLHELNQFRMTALRSLEWQPCQTVPANYSVSSKLDISDTTSHTHICIYIFVRTSYSFSVQLNWRYTI